MSGFLTICSVASALETVANSCHLQRVILQLRSIEFYIFLRWTVRVYTKLYSLHSLEVSHF